MYSKFIKKKIKSVKNIFLIFKADQGEKYGYGHLYRMLSIYNLLKKIQI